MTRLAPLAPIALAAVLAGCHTQPAAVEVIPIFKSTTPEEGVRNLISETWVSGAPGPTIVIE